MSPADLRSARKRLKLTQKGLAKALRMGAHGWQSISKWERDGGTVPGPVQVAVELMLAHHPNIGGSMTDRYPNIWKLRQLVEHCVNGNCASSNDGKHYVPARPVGFASIGSRIRAARLVFSGKADAVIWDQGQ